jgi:hypothetical protein
VEKQKAGNDAPTALKNLKNKIPHKFDKVYKVRAETEEFAVEQQKAGNTALTATKDIENKVNVVFVSPRNSTCRSRIYSDNQDQHHRHQEHAHRA